MRQNTELGRYWEPSSDGNVGMKINSMLSKALWACLVQSWALGFNLWRIWTVVFPNTITSGPHVCCSLSDSLTSDCFQPFNKQLLEVYYVHITTIDASQFQASHILLCCSSLSTYLTLSNRHTHFWRWSKQSIARGVWI